MQLAVGVCPLKYYQSMIRVVKCPTTLINLLPVDTVKAEYVGIAKVAFQTALKDPLIMDNVEFFLVEAEGWEEVLVGRDDLKRYELLPDQIANMLNKRGKPTWHSLRVMEGKPLFHKDPTVAMAKIMQEHGIKNTGTPYDRCLLSEKKMPEKGVNHERRDLVPDYVYTPPEVYLCESPKHVTPEALKSNAIRISHGDARIFFTTDWASRTVLPVSYAQRKDILEFAGLGQIDDLKMLEEPVRGNPEQMEERERFPLTATQIVDLLNTVPERHFTEEDVYNFYEKKKDEWERQQHQELPDNNIEEGNRKAGYAKK